MLSDQEIWDALRDHEEEVEKYKKKARKEYAYLQGVEMAIVTVTRTYYLKGSKLLLVVTKPHPILGGGVGWTICEVGKK